MSPVAQPIVVPSHYHIISLRSIRIPHDSVLRLRVPISESVKRQIGDEVVQRSDTIEERPLFGKESCCMLVPNARAAKREDFRVCQVPRVNIYLANIGSCECCNFAA